jgi:hypothetical protein
MALGSDPPRRAPAGSDLGRSCVWRLGGGKLPGTTRNFGGSSVTEYRYLAQEFSPITTNGVPGVQYKYENFQLTLPYNPCG